MSEDTPRQEQMFSVEDSPAKTCPSQAIARAWVESDQGCGSSFFDALRRSVPAGSWSKTSLASCRRTTGGILEPSSGGWKTSGMGSHGEFWTLGSSEYPSAGVECSLSDVLLNEPVPPKYYLSPKAARGVLRRSEKRGRALPPALSAALLAVSEGETTLEQTREPR